MINSILHNLINDFPKQITNNIDNPVVIDLVLDGGAFNGSYLVGALYLLKEMEKRQYIKIKRISGCSIGSVAGFLYFIDGLDAMSTIYNIAIQNFKKNRNLQIIKDLKHLLHDNIPEDVCSMINNKLFITYNNIDNGSKIIKRHYKNVNDVFDSIVKSCYIPYMIDGNILYNNKYVDGITPYIFKIKKNRKILYLDLFGYDKIFNVLNIKNEEKNTGRVLNGLLDMHFFFTKNSNTTMCSYIHNWSLFNCGCFKFKLVIEKIIILILRFYIFIKTHLLDEFEDFKIYKFIKNIIREFYVIIVDNYFV
jgi:hypothetical protein